MAKLVGGGVKNQDVVNLHGAMIKESIPIPNVINERSMKKDNIHEHPVVNKLKSQLNKFTNTPNVKINHVDKVKQQNKNQNKGGRGK